MLLTALLPIFLAAGVLLFRHFQSVVTDSRSLATCRTELARAQSTAGRSIQKILELNPLIRTARAAKATAQAAMVAAAAAGNPVAVAAAARALSMAEQSLKALALRQHMLLLEGRAALIQGHLRARKAVEMVWRENNRAFSPTELRGIFLPTSPPHLAVRAVNPADSPPEYVLEDRFGERQTLHLRWQVTQTPRKENETWIRFTTEQKQDCRVTLRTPPHPAALRPVLTEGRSWWKP